MHAFSMHAKIGYLRHGKVNVTYTPQDAVMCNLSYRQTSNVRRTLVGNTIVDR